VAEGVGRFFDASPEAEFVSLGPGDGTAFCECERCRALDVVGDQWSHVDKEPKPVLTERWLTFVNAVARRLRQTHPGKSLYTIAYHQTFRPPDPAIIRPEPNVMIQVVNSRPNYVSFVHRLEDARIQEHVKFRAGMEQWLSATPAGCMVYQYTPHSQFRCMPAPAPRKFIADVKYLWRAGAIGYEGQSGAGAWGLYGINLYAIAKATWDPSVDADALIRDYCQSAFHEAAEPMIRFLAALEEGMERAEPSPNGVWQYLTAETMGEARRHMDAALAAAREQIVRDRLRGFNAHFHYAELAAPAWRRFQQALATRDRAALDEAIEGAREADAFMRAELKAAPAFVTVRLSAKAITPKLFETIWKSGRTSYQ